MVEPKPVSDKQKSVLMSNGYDTEKIAQMDSKTASVIIGAIFDSSDKSDMQQPIEYERPEEPIATAPVTFGKPKNGNTAIQVGVYVSYVKDMIIAGSDIENAIAKIKQAKDAFE